ncbi:SGNH/GDSL hydrolase family protein [Allosphingosinicella deserti]|uniref:Lipase n=1 Tax=Allosphingosinicella deserti TaxID=2116704 RepID=A0A2P7QZ47_9SPHN|nr:SGNH/GDSL hydrolase family protein [Sphingomonas deserti]PSJ43242.1 lipase [Sphingomonas deserti]
MRFLLCVTALALLGATAPPASPAASPLPLPLNVGGRVIKEADGSLSFGWPGTYFEGRFRGRAVRVVFDAPAEHLRLFVDGALKRTFVKPGKVDLIVDNLGSGEHDVRLEKLTESQTGGGRFIGFYPAKGSITLPAKPRARQIEFIGDSYTVGYGNTSAKRACTADEIHDTTDTQQAFGPLVARHFDADYRINAYSGFGIVRNYNGSSPDLSLPILYPRLKPDDPAHETDDVGWNPWIIVINLGTNDFSTPVKAGERWADQDELKAAYRTRYLAFVRELGSRHKLARFILMGSDTFFAEIETIAAALRTEMPDRVQAIRFRGLDLAGCDWHPSIADDRLMAGLIQQTIGSF